MKRIFMAIAIAIPLIMAVLVATFAPASGTEPCIPQAANTEVIEHDEVFHMETVIITPEQAAIPEVWANWSPNNDNGPQDYIPVWPIDERGTWQTHDKIPGGHEGPDGVYQRDNPGRGNSDWFYRKNGQDYIPAVTEEVKIVDEEAWTEIVEHPAVDCPDVKSPDPDSPEDPVKNPPVCNDMRSRFTTPCGDADGDDIVRDDPVVTTNTTYQNNATIKVYIHESGKTTTSVVQYEGDILEEGL